LRVAVADAKSGEPVWYEASVVGTQRSSDLAVLRVQLADGEGKDGGLVPVKVSLFWLFWLFLVIFGYFGNLRMGNSIDVVFCFQGWHEQGS
jgi:hypothetical protein